MCHSGAGEAMRLESATGSAGAERRAATAGPLFSHSEAKFAPYVAAGGMTAPALTASVQASAAAAIP